jgi:hypothetical protein
MQHPLKINSNGKVVNYQLATWRAVFEEAKNDPDFKIIIHPAVK